MLLKTFLSNPALNSWFQQQQSESDFMIHQNLKSPTTISFNSSNLLHFSPKKKNTRTSSDSDLLSFSRSKRVNCLRSSCVDVLEDVEGEEIESNGFLFSSSGLDGNNEGCRVEFLMDGTGGGGKNSGGGDGGNGDYDDSTYVYYRNMIEANPYNSLILGNYAKYLKEVRGDVLKAEEYCSRAILANPSDGNALSMYADLIWETQKDSSRAQSYFDQAVKASPDDCYVMASYARFLWDADEEDEEEVSDMTISALSFLHEASKQFPTAATHHKDEESSF